MTKCDQKTSGDNFFFNFMRIREGLTPHNWGCIMMGRHKNFKDPMYRSSDMSKTKIQNQGFLSAHPLSIAMTLNIERLDKCEIHESSTSGRRRKR